jgi:hypothetical protein
MASSLFYSIRFLMMLSTTFGPSTDCYHRPSGPVSMRRGRSCQMLSFAGTVPDALMHGQFLASMSVENTFGSLP